MENGTRTSELWAGVATGIGALSVALASEDRWIQFAAICGTCVMTSVYIICRTMLKQRP